MRSVTKARPWFFSRDPDSPAIREVLGSGRATTVDGVGDRLRPGADPFVELVDILTLAGLSFNVKFLAATSAALAIGLPAEAVVEGLRWRFLPDAEHNPGRMTSTLPVDGDHLSVVMDLAHNEAGLEALIEIMGGVRRPGARLMLGLGAVGDSRRRRADRRAPGKWAKGGDIMAMGTRSTTCVAAPWTRSTSCCARVRPGSASRTSRPTGPRSSAWPRWSAQRSRRGRRGPHVPRGARQGVYDYG